MHLRRRGLLQQFIVPILVVGIVVLFVSIYSAMQLHHSIDALGALQEYGDERLRVIEDIESSMTFLRAASLNHMASESASEMRNIYNEIEHLELEIRRSFERITSELMTEDLDSLESTQTVLTMAHKYIAEIYRMLEQSADFEKEMAFIIMTDAEQRNLPLVNSSLQTLKRNEFDLLSASRSTLSAAVDRNLITTVGVGIGGGGVILVIAFLVTRRITLRLERLLNWSYQISAGQFPGSLEADSADEVGMLTHAMNEMAQNVSSAQSDLTQAKHQAENTAEELRIYATAFDNSGEAMLISDRDNRIINVNEAFTEITGYNLQDVRGKNPSILASDETPAVTYQHMWSDLNEKGFWQGELWDRSKDGSVYPKWAAISAIRDSDNEVSFYMSSFTDISDRKEAANRIEHLAHHDILTGLQNRFNLESQLEQSIAIAHREQKKLALLFIDLDRFKIINDSLGHHTGDQVLIEVANRLRDCVRESDIVARIGGDEFVVAVRDLDSTNVAAVLAEKILSKVAKPYVVEGKELMTSPSIGISIYPEDGSNVDELMQTADVAMYHAKDLGRNNYQYFTESMLVEANRRIDLEREFRTALKDNQLILHFQPQVHAIDMTLASVEALVRWRHPEKGLIMPDVFIPIAEESGLIQELGQWVLSETVSQLTKWRNDGLTGFKVSVNLSAKQLQTGNLKEEISDILSLHSFQGSDIELELTESATMNDPERAIEELSALRELGINLSIDDFGTGYSSLAYLKRLPIHILKLDRSFVRDIETDPNDAEICQATIALAHNLGLKVVAEGVETAEQRDFLTHLRCDFLQGYLISKPVPAEEISVFASQNLRAVPVEIPVRETRV